MVELEQKISSDSYKSSFEISHSENSRLCFLIKSVRNFLVIPGSSLLLSEGVLMTLPFTIKTLLAEPSVRYPSRIKIASYAFSL